MSNKIVPGIYRAVIDDVISSIKGDFEKFDVSEDILAELQHKWENKVIQSRVAEFEVASQPAASTIPPQHHPYPAPHPHAHMYAPPPGPHSAYAAPALPHHYAPHTGVKTEPMDPRYMLNQPHQMVYAVPPLPGPQINGISRPPTTGGQTGILSFPPGPPATSSTTNGANGNANAPGVPLGRPYIPPTAASSTAASSSSTPTATPPQSQSQSQTSQISTNSGGGGSGGRIPQLDGPSEDDDSDEDSRTPPPLPYIPRSNHPSLPQIPAQPAAGSSAVDAEAINSDLDDSDIDDEDDEKEEGSGVDTDIVFCTYEKVTRVKNKWRCTFKDGIIHVNGKDYLFAKCNGEFEW